MGHLFTLSSNISSGGKVITLKCTHIDGYQISLSTDIVPNVLPQKVKFLQFHLCTEDINFILNPENNSVIRLPETVISSLRSHLNDLGDCIIERRSWSLLGNDILAVIGMIKLNDVVILCDTKSFTLSNWDTLFYLEINFLGMNYLGLPSEENKELHDIADEFVSVEDVLDYSDFV
jgi:hypothetical protein